MATITSAGSGLASETSTWVGGVVPVEGDKVIIAAGHVVTVNGTFTWGDDSVTTTIPNAAINVSGTLKASRSVNSSLTAKGLILVNFATFGIDYGTEVDPIPDGVTAELILNKATTPAIRTGLQQVTPVSGAGNFSKWSFVGASGRVRGVDLETNATTSSSTIRLTSASHGWKVGDEVGFFTTTDNTTTDQCEIRTISSIGVDPKDITLNAAPTYLHLAGSPVCNLSSNVVLKSFNAVAGQTATLSTQFPNALGTPATNGYFYIFKDSSLHNLGGSSVNVGVFNTSSTSPGDTANFNYGIFLNNCGIKNNISGASVFNLGPQRPAEINGCSVFMAGPTHYGGGKVRVSNSWICGTFLNEPTGGGGNIEHTDCWFTSRSYNGSVFGTYPQFITRFRISGSATAIGGYEFTDCDIGHSFGWRAFVGDKWLRLGGTAHNFSVIRSNRCSVNSTWLSIPDGAGNLANQSDGFRFDYINKNKDATQQETYYAAGTVKRENVDFIRSTSSVAITHNKTGSSVNKKQEILCSSGASVRIVGYVKVNSLFYNGGGSNWNPPTVTISGNGITPVTFTASVAANNAWEKFDLSATNSSGIDGNFTLTFTANAKSVSTGTVWFSGVPDSPFVTKCRHYGFNFDESNPVRVVDPYVVATEEVASGYTGATINGTTKKISSGSIGFTFDYDNDTLGGTAGTDKAVVLMGIRPGSGKFAVATGTLSRSKGITLSLTAETDRGYV